MTIDLLLKYRLCGTCEDIFSVDVLGSVSDLLPLLIAVTIRAYDAQDYFRKELPKRLAYAFRLCLIRINMHVDITFFRFWY
jgi:hypothetical protein